MFLSSFNSHSILLSLDAMIQGRELVDSKEDYEVVDKEDWEVEMDMEEEEEEVMTRSNAQATNGKVVRAY
jgi:hypothetical protein